MMPFRRVWPLLLLAGCAASGDDAGAAMQAALETNRASLGVLQLGWAQPVIPRSTPIPSAAGTAAAPAAPQQQLLTGAVPATAAALIGASPESLLRVLGPPRLLRSEGTGEIWLYAGPDCHLDLVLYAEAGGARVAHAQARADGAVPRTETECLAGIVQRGV
ncbi:MAG: hypothetical protein JWO26_3735 [Rhodospirillales bacterium]|nr:hypothetical protein [Rhodospirillales bacterium]